MNTFLRWAALTLISFFTEQALDKDQIKRVKDFVVLQAGILIDTKIKHQRTADLIREIAGDLSDDLINWIIKTVLWVARATGQISVEQKPEESK